MKNVFRRRGTSNAIQSNEQILSMSFVTSSAIKLLILTGARRGEVAAMRWDELNLDAGVWLLPSERTKNRQAHTIYLSNLAVEIIQSLLPISGNSQFVFDTGHYIERMLNHQPLNKLVAIYQRAVYADEQKSTWSDWGKLIEHQLAQVVRVPNG